VELGLEEEGSGQIVAWNKKDEEEKSRGSSPTQYSLFPTRMAATIRP
jgi:hypothetical protein